MTVQPPLTHLPTTLGDAATRRSSGRVSLTIPNFMNGPEHATNHWMPGRIEVAGLTIECDPVPHPLLGEALPIRRGDQLLTHMSVIDWDRPTSIPAIAAPGALPPGTGGAVLNLI